MGTMSIPISIIIVLIGTVLGGLITVNYYFKYKKISDEIDKIISFNKNDFLLYNSSEEYIIKPLYQICREKQKNKKEININFLQEVLYSKISETGFIKFLPNMFIAIGLILTFLGLSLILKNASSQEIEKLKEMLSNMSFAFYMSISGIFTSVINSIFVTIIKRFENITISKSLLFINKLYINFTSDNNIKTDYSIEERILSAIEKQEDYIKSLKNLDTFIDLKDNMINTTNQLELTSAKLIETSSVIMEFNSKTDDFYKSLIEKMNDIVSSINRSILEIDNFSKNNILELKNQIDSVKNSLNEVIKTFSNEAKKHSKDLEEKVSSLDFTISEMIDKIIPTTKFFNQDFKDFTGHQNEIISNLNNALIKNTRAYEEAFSSLKELLNENTYINEKLLNISEKSETNIDKINTILNDIPNKLFNITNALDNMRIYLNNFSPENLDYLFKPRIEKIDNKLNYLEKLELLESINNKELIVNKENNNLTKLENIFYDLREIQERQLKLIQETNTIMKENSKGIFKKIKEKLFTLTNNKV